MKELWILKLIKAGKREPERRGKNLSEGREERPGLKETTRHMAQCKDQGGAQKTFNPKMKVVEF